MKRIIIFLMLIFCGWTLPGQETAEALEQRLAWTSGKERTEILYRLSRHYRDGEPQQAIEYGSRALELLRGLPDGGIEIRVLNSMARARVNLGEYKKALALGKRSRMLAETSGDREGLAEALTNIGDVHRKTGEYGRSLAFYTDALAIWKTLENKGGIAESFRSIGIVYTRRGDFDRALKYSLDALNLEEALGRRKERAYCLNLVGAIYQQLKKYPQALDYYSRSLEIQERLGNQRGIANCLNNIGVIHQDTGDYAKALDYYLKFIGIETSLGNKDGMSIGFNNTGEVYMLMGNHQQALNYYLKSLQIAEELSNKYGMAYTGNNVAAVFRAQGRYAEALKQAGRALEIAKEIESVELVTGAYRELSQIYAATKNFQKAYEFHKLFKAENDEIFNESNVSRIAEMQARYESEKKEKEIALLKEKEKIQDLEIARQKGRATLYGVIGFLLLVIGVIYTISRRYTHKTGIRLRESEEKYRNLVERANDAIAIAQNGVFKYVNPAFMRMLGYTEAELIEQSIAMVIAPEERERVVSNNKRRMAGEPVETQYETLMQRKDGSKVDVELNAGLFSFEKRPANMVLLRDISERKQLEAERLKHGKLEAVGILAAGIAHDFNNILTVIMGHIDLARMSVPSDNTKLLTGLANAEKMSLKARDLAKRFLTFSEGGTPITRVQSLRPIVKEAVDVTLMEFGGKCRVKLPPDLWPIDCDGEQIHQVLTALLANAVEAVHGRGDIVIKAANKVKEIAEGGPLAPGNYVKITVSDSGEGIPPEHLPNVFDLYFSTRRRVTQKGLGFGLSIAYSIVQRHHGHIEVASRVGKGTVVTVCLPAPAAQGPS